MKSFFRTGRKAVDAAMRRRFERVKATPKIYLCACGNTRSPQAERCAGCNNAKRRKYNADRRATERVTKLIEKFNEAQIETQPNVETELESPKSADMVQRSEVNIRTPEQSERDHGASLRVDNNRVSQRTPRSIWTIGHDEFRERTISMPHLRRGKQT